LVTGHTISIFRVRLGYSAATATLCLAMGSCGSPAAPTVPVATLAVTAVSPASGSTFGGVTITITGTNFNDDAVVTIGGTTPTRVVVINAYSITAMTGQHAVGPVEIAVTSRGNTARLPNAFTYVSPGPVANNPPTIVSVTGQGTRTNSPPGFADFGEEINLTAVVQDREAQPQDLSYEWTATAGTFSGNGPTVRWRAPASTGSLTTSLTVSVTVVERYNDADPATGLPIPKENRVSRSTVISVHDSAREIGNMARQFLLDFSDSSIRDISFILRNFSDTCPAKVEEGNDITDNRKNFKITAFSIGPPVVTVGFGGTCPFRARPGDACAQVPADWTSIYLPNGTIQHVIGTDQVVAVYRANEGGWRLCESDFNGSGGNTGFRTFIR
jgi:hypothetical protein